MAGGAAEPPLTALTETGQRCGTAPAHQSRPAPSLARALPGGRACTPLASLARPSTGSGLLTGSASGGKPTHLQREASRAAGAAPGRGKGEQRRSHRAAAPRCAAQTCLLGRRGRGEQRSRHIELAAGQPHRRASRRAPAPSGDGQLQHIGTRCRRGLCCVASNDRL